MDIEYYRRKKKSTPSGNSKLKEGLDNAFF